MIATTIGRTFLKAYNEKNNKSLTAKEFFETEYFEYFFNHPKYMQWVGNSPFTQMKTGQKSHLLSKEERLEKLEDLNNKIDKGDRDASVFIGARASETKEFATTSGAVSDIDISIDNEEVYYSWIGGGLGIGIAGGYSIFFDVPELLLNIYDGWKFYRLLLNDIVFENLKANQINTWNGQWLNFLYSKKNRGKVDIRRIAKLNIFKVSNKGSEIETVSWSELFFSFSRKFSNGSYTGYVYSLGQTNKTLGFYPFQFQAAANLTEYYTRLFGENAAIDNATDYENLFGIHIKRACEKGSIGLQALEPKDLRKYFGKDSNLKLVKPSFKEKSGESQEDSNVRKQLLKDKDEKNIITYRTYKTWLLAMITKNKEESLEYTLEVAKALHEYREGSKKTDRLNLIKSELLVSKSKKGFLDALTTIIRDVDIETLTLFKTLRDKVHMMTSEDFGYFVVLLKFDYAYQERELKK
ncbi:MAG: hypothetical protein WBG43_08355 [Marinifilaceae bacterium]